MQRFKETKDIPFLVESSSYVERSTLRAKITALLVELSDDSTPKHCVPIVFAKKVPDINGLLHLSLEEKDFSTTLPLHQTDTYNYITALMMNYAFAQSLYSEMNSPQHRIECENSNLFLILRTIFNTLVPIYQKFHFEITHWLGSHSNIDDFLTWTFTKYSANAVIDSASFSNKLENLMIEGAIKNLTEASVNSETALAAFDNAACVRWNKERTAWEVNAQAFDTVLQNLGMPVSTYQALRMLEQEGFLCAPKINRDS